MAIKPITVFILTLSDNQTFLPAVAFSAKEGDFIIQENGNKTIIYQLS
jgi:hypothetical protein